MNKKLFFILILAMLALGLHAQAADNSASTKYPKVGRFEVEWMAVGAVMPFSSNGEFGYDGGFQIRENIQNTPWSYGVFLGIYLPQLKEYHTTSYTDYEGNVYTGEYSTTSYPGAFLTGVVGEYDFRRGTGINPYVNVSSGFAWGGPVTLRPYLRPSIGIEVFHHLRLGIHATLMTHRGSGFGVSVSAVFGGRP